MSAKTRDGGPEGLIALAWQCVGLQGRLPASPKHSEGGLRCATVLAVA